MSIIGILSKAIDVAVRIAPAIDMAAGKIQRAVRKLRGKQDSASVPLPGKHVIHIDQMSKRGASHKVKPNVPK